MHKINYKENILEGTNAYNDTVLDKLVILSITYAEPVSLEKSEVDKLIEGISTFREVDGHYTKDVTINLALRVYGGGSLSFSIWGTDSNSSLMRKLYVYLSPQISPMLYYVNKGTPGDITRSLFTYEDESAKEHVYWGIRLLNNLVVDYPSIEKQANLNFRSFFLEILMNTDTNIDDLSYNFCDNKLFYSSEKKKFEQFVPNDVATLVIANFICRK